MNSRVNMTNNNTNYSREKKNDRVRLNTSYNGRLRIADIFIFFTKTDTFFYQFLFIGKPIKIRPGKLLYHLNF